MELQVRLVCAFLALAGKENAATQGRGILVSSSVIVGVSLRGRPGLETKRGGHRGAPLHTIAS